MDVSALMVISKKTTTPHFTHTSNLLNQTHRNPVKICHFLRKIGSPKKYQWSVQLPVLRFLEQKKITMF